LDFQKKFQVLIPIGAHLRNLCAARLAADVYGVPTVIMSRTDAESAIFLTSDVDERDREFIDISVSRTPEGFFHLKKGTGLKHCIKRSLSAAPFTDLLWWETSTPNLEHAKEFAEAIQKEFPEKMMAYNCSPSFNWRANLSPETIAKFQANFCNFLTFLKFQKFSGGTRSYGLQIPIYCAGRIPFIELWNVRTCPKLQGSWNVRLFRISAGRI
jgi:isocitrate lyase